MIYPLPSPPVVAVAVYNLIFVCQSVSVTYMCQYYSSYPDYFRDCFTANEKLHHYIQTASMHTI